MSAGSWTHVCSVCGTEEGLDSLINRMLDDDQTRRLIAAVITKSLPVGGQVVSYLRLHKPLKQRLRLTKATVVLDELVGDITRGAITRKGRDWAAPLPAWKAAFDAVFEARDKGVLSLPLDGNAYLYEVLLRQADKIEAASEKEREQQARGRAHVAGTPSAAAVLGALVPSATATPATAAESTAGTATEAPATPALTPERREQLAALKARLILS